MTNQRGLLLRVVEWVRDADMIIQSLHSDWNFLYSEFKRDTIVGNDTILKPDDLGIWDRESFAVDRGTEQGRALNLIDFTQWRNNNNLKTNGDAETITIEPNGNLRLSNPSASTNEIYAGYWKSPTLLTNNTDEPPYPKRFQRVIVARAKMFFFEDQEAWNNYQSAEKEFSEWLGKLKSHSLPGQQEFGQTQPELMAVRTI